MRYKITDEQLASEVKNCRSMKQLMETFGIKYTGGSFSHYKKRLKNLGIDTSHFLGKGWSSGSSSSVRLLPSDVLILRESGGRQKAYLLRRSLIESGVEYVCAVCNSQPVWNGHPLTLDVDHINENWLDDRLENLRFLCPNCHSQFTRKLLDN